MTPDTVVRVEANVSTVAGSLRPSSKWRMHRRLLGLRSDCHAVVHFHSRHTTILACSNRPIPPMHYMVAVSSGASAPVAPYATFGSEALADAVVDTLGGPYATRMASHGQVVVASGLELGPADRRGGRGTGGRLLPHNGAGRPDPARRDSYAPHAQFRDHEPLTDAPSLGKMPAGHAGGRLS
jgi:Class II Aldolase and Adducin N-terminal domain